jgi:hypothetical protein
MLDNNTIQKSKGAQTENSMGLKSFSSTGRDEAAVEILRPKTDPAVMRRTLLLIAVVIIAVLIMAKVAYQRSGLDFIPKADSGPSFGGGHSDQVPMDPK